MKGLLQLALGSLLVLLTSGGLAAPPTPGQHFDCSDGGSGVSCASDDPGCVPQTKDDPSGGVAATLKCGDAIAKAFGAAVRAVIKCHKAMADSVLKGSPVDDEACESGPGKSAKGKLDAAITKVGPVCTSTQLTLAAAEEATLFANKSNPLSLDAQAAAVYCDGSMPIDPAGAGGDDAGTIDSTAADAKDRLKCADTVGSELGKLAAAAIKCHIKLADSDFKAKDFDENVCEELDPVKGKSALQKYNAAMTKLTSKGICTQSCLTEPNRLALGQNILAQVEAGNQITYPCAGTTSTTTTTTTTSSTTTTCPPMSCSCAGGTPSTFSFTTVIGSGTCGHLDGDGNPNMYSLACGGLYFGGAGVGVPLPSKVPDYGSSFLNACCSGTTLTLSGTSSAQAGGNRCIQGLSSKRGMSCTTNSDCAGPCSLNSDCSPGGTCSGGGTCTSAKCALLQCTNAGCLYGPPLPIPNAAHNSAATSTCVINTITANGSGTADCSAGSVTALNLPLSSALFLDSDLMTMRCSGGSNAGANCTGNGGCGTVAAGTPCPGGTCVNDTGRCRNGFGDPADTPCCSDTDCGGGAGVCETGRCQGGSNANFGCITDADCPGGSCITFIQPCPICGPNNKCDGGINDGLSCTPGDTIPDGDYPTSHDCPPPPAASLGALPIPYLLDTGTVQKVSVDLPDQAAVFCGFCRSKTLNTFARRCNGSASGVACSCSIGTPCVACGGDPCLPVPCTSNTDCSTLGAFNSCGQRTSGAFTAVDVARTIVETGTAAGALTTGGLPQPGNLVSIFCIPLTFNSLVDSAGDLPGPGAVALPVTMQIQ